MLPAFLAIVFAAVASGTAPSGGDAAAPPWRWDSSRQENPRQEVAGPEGHRFVFSAKGKPSLRRIGAHGARVWIHRVEPWKASRADLVLDGETLYAALYRGAASGCRVAALDARSGALRWEAMLEGVGFVAHSAYMNRVQIEVARAGLVIYGKEWKGRYIEVLRLSDGHQIGHKFLGR